MNNKLIIALIVASSIIFHGIITKPQYIQYEVIKTDENSVLIIDHKENKIYEYHHTNYVGDHKIQLVEMP